MFFAFSRESHAYYIQSMCNIISKARKFSKYVTLVRHMKIPNSFLTQKKGFPSTICLQLELLK